MLRMLQSDKTWKPLKIRVYPKRTWWSFPKRRRLICKDRKGLQPKPYWRKREIARKAVSFIREGECIILDSGSTTTEIAKLLTQYKELTVITNALNIALILGENPGITLIVTGGEFKAPTLSLTGKMAADSLKGFHANKLFLATAGISPDMSLTYPSLSDLMVKSAMIKAAEEVILVADSSKIGISAFASLGSITMVNSFITDNHISKENIEKMKGKNINLLIG